MDIGYWPGRVCAEKYGLKRATLDAQAHSASQPLVLGSETQALDGPENKNYPTLENPQTLDYKNPQIVTLEKREYRLRMFGY